MGLFSSKKKIFTSSVVYNLAGEEDERPNYLKTIILGNVLSSNPKDLGELINTSYLNGPGIRLRNFARWAREHGFTDLIGQVAGTISTESSIDAAVLVETIPHAAEETVQLQVAEIGQADYTYWVDRYMAENYPALIDTNYVADYDTETANLITITFEDLSTVSFTPTDFDIQARYLYVGYNLSTEGAADPVETGDVVTLGSGESFPSTSGWTENSYVPTTHPVTLTTTTEVSVTYSDSTPPEYSSSSTDEETSYLEFHGEWERTDYQGQMPGTDSIYSVRQIQYQDQTGEVVSDVTEDTVYEDMGGGVTKTTVTTVTTESIELTRTYRVDTQHITLESWSGIKVMIYKYGSGNAAYDAMFVTNNEHGEFFPFIPVRLWNKFLSTSYQPTVYPEAKRAYRRATTGRYDKLIARISDNSSLGDIDFAYVMFGVSLNVKENACKKYLFKLFKGLYDDAALSSSGEYTAWYSQWLAASNSVTAWNAWKVAQSNPSDPLYGTAQPVRLKYPQMPSREIHVKSANNTVMNYDFRISWNYIEEYAGTGLAKVDAKVGDLWFEQGTTEDFLERVYSNNNLVPADTRTSGRITLYWQISATEWKAMSITGLHHRNTVYKGKGEDITEFEALADSDESGFIFPLNEQIYRSMSIKDATQMATACTFIVFNCYKVKKVKWYQSKIFKIVIVIAAVAISIIASPGAGAGVMGTAAATGTAMGFTGMTAVIMGAVANAVAAIVITQIVTMGATALFGEKIGSIVGAVASIVTIQVGTAMANGTTLSASFGELAKADNILRMTSAIGKGYTGYAQEAIAETQRKTAAVVEDYEAQAREIDQLYEENIGYGRGVIDPLSFTDSYESYPPESPDKFFQRTLMLGTDVVELSQALIDNFVAITLSTDLPT